MMGLTRSKIRTAREVIFHGGFPWPSGAAAGATLFERRFRRHGRRMVMAQWPPLLRPFATIAMTLIWPVASLRNAIRTAGSALPGSLGGRSRRGATLSAWGCALRRNVLPLEYFAFRMFERRGHSVDAWTLGDEGTRVFASLIAQEANALADDKHAFAAFCARVGVPAVPSLALYAKGRPVEPFATGQPPERDLVIKPRKGARTEGIEPWFFHGGAYHGMPEGYSPSGPALDSAQFERHLAEVSKAYRQVLVQPALRPHPELRALAGTGVPTARVVTGAWPDGRVEIVDAMVQRPADGEFVSQGYRYALVDPETGR
ncbi:MAG: sugar-transfer associated ATP-grasp domain-containing protein, partial [Alphaproteobacteria bacterium]